MAAAVCAGGLALPGTASRADELHACTQIGCASAVYVDADAYRVSHGHIRRVVVCVEGRCQAKHWRRNSQWPPAPFEVPVRSDRERSVAVKIVMYDGRGRRRFRKIGTAFLRKVQPNGPECEPICFIASVRVSRHGRLRQTI